MAATPCNANHARSHEKGDINISFSFVPYIPIVAIKAVDSTKMQ
jgi:hypothetical protein